MTAIAAITGVGMTRFGKHKDRSLTSLGEEAINAALSDAGIIKDDVQMAFVANAMAAIVTGEVSAVGQGILRSIGFSGIPVFNIDNACAGSSSALNLAVQAIAAGNADTVLVLGVEKLVADDRSLAYRALNGAADAATVAASGIDPAKESVFVAAIYPERFERYAGKYGLESRTLAKISAKNRENAALNPIAQFTSPLTEDEILQSRQIVGPLTAMMCAPIGDGAAALIVTRVDKVTAKQRAVSVLASVVAMGGVGEAGSSIGLAATAAYAKAGLTPGDIDIAEVHDSISFNELLAYEELGFCEQGKGADLVAEGATRRDGRIPVNVSGGLESRGHPVAATGAAQIVELVQHLRNEAGIRQVAGARFALAENAGGFALDDTAAIVITILGAPTLGVPVPQHRALSDQSGSS